MGCGWVGGWQVSASFVVALLSPNDKGKPGTFFLPVLGGGRGWKRCLGHTISPQKAQAELPPPKGSETEDWGEGEGEEGGQRERGAWPHTSLARALGACAWRIHTRGQNRKRKGA